MKRWSVPSMEGKCTGEKANHKEHREHKENETRVLSFRFFVLSAFSCGHLKGYVRCA